MPANGKLPFQSSIPLIGYTTGSEPTLGNGDIESYSPIKATDRGALYTTLIVDSASGGGSGQQLQSLQTNIDDISLVSSSNHALMSAALAFAYNGDNTTSFDRWRNNHFLVPLISTARTASVDSADFVNYNARGAHFTIDVTAITATPEITVTIQGKDAQFASNDYYDLLTSAPITATGKTILKIYPGIGEVPNGAASDILPRIFRVSVSNANADSITYSIGCNLVV